MFNTILVPTDGSELSGKAAAAAIEFAKGSGARLVILSVAEPYPTMPIGDAPYTSDLVVYERKMLELSQESVEKVAAQAQQAGVAYETQVLQSFNPYEDIVRTAKEKGCDVIFIASHGRRGVSRLFVGSQTQKVLAHSTVPVMVFR